MILTVFAQKELETSMLCIHPISQSLCFENEVMIY